MLPSPEGSIFVCLRSLSNRASPRALGSLRMRPIDAGEMPMTNAWLAGVSLFAAASAIAAPVQGIDPARLSKHVQVLSSDAFEGRGPATPAETKTVDYIIGQFRTVGLQPGGDIVDGKRQ